MEELSKKYVTLRFSRETDKCGRSVMTVAGNVLGREEAVSVYYNAHQERFVILKRGGSIVESTSEPETALFLVDSVFFVPQLMSV